MLKGLPNTPDPALLVGFDTSDDACVYRLSDTLALIQTADFFPPVVDDPYLYGQVAAANALSDIYAMGGRPRLALNLLCFPACLPLGMVREILAGGQSKVAEAGAVVAGGHSIEDDVPKYGLCVTGFAHPEKIWANKGARPGDVLVLTKPLGIGVLATAAKADLITQAEFRPAIDTMAALNRRAAELAEGFDIHACTDITGFGLLGHGLEMAAGSRARITLRAAGLPLLDRAAQLAREGIVPGGAYRNMEYVRPRCRLAEGVPRHLLDLMADPQTSGGLLLALPESQAGELARRLVESGLCGALVGWVDRPAGEDGAILEVI